MIGVWSSGVSYLYFSLWVCHYQLNKVMRRTYLSLPQEILCLTGWFVPSQWRRGRNIRWSCSCMEPVSVEMTMKDNWRMADRCFWILSTERNIRLSYLFLNVRQVATGLIRNVRNHCFRQICLQDRRWVLLPGLSNNCWILIWPCPKSLKNGYILSDCRWERWGRMIWWSVIRRFLRLPFPFADRWIRIVCRLPKKWSSVYFMGMPMMW